MNPAFGTTIKHRCVVTDPEAGLCAASGHLVLPVLY